MDVEGHIGSSDEGLVRVAKGAVLVPYECLLAAGAEFGDGGGRLVEAGAAGLHGGGGHALREAEDAIWVSADGGAVVAGGVEGGVGGQGWEEGGQEVGLVWGVRSVVAGRVDAPSEHRA